MRKTYNMNQLNKIATLCGNPDASEACRLILKEIRGTN